MPVTLKITGKLVALVVGLLLLQGGVTIAWMSTAFHRELVKQELQELGSDVSLASLDLASDVERARSLALALVDVPAIDGIARARANDGVDPYDGSTEAQWRERLAVIFRSTLAGNPDITQLRYIGVADDGLEIVRVEREQAGAPIRVLRADELQHKGTRPYFQAVLQLPRGSVYTSRIELNREHGAVAEPEVPVLRTAAPAFDHSGQRFGAVVINFDMNAAFGRMRGDIGDGRSLFVVNADGDFLLHPDPARTFGFDRGQRYTFAESFPELADLRATMAGRGTTPVTHTAKGVAVGVAYAKMPLDASDPSRRLLVLVSADRESIVAHPTAVVRQCALAALAFLALAAMVASFVARRMTTPIRALSRTASVVASGDLHARAEVRSTDELGELGAAFNGMADSLERQQLALEERATGLDARMTAIVNTAVDAIITINERGVIESCNRATEDVFGYDAAALVGENVKLLMPSPTSEDHDGYLRRYVEGGPARFIGGRREVVGLHKDGSRILLQIAVSEVRMGGERLFTGIIRDITEQKRAARELDRFFSLSPELLAIATIDGSFRRVNLAFEEAIGLSAEELCARPLVDIVHPDDRDRTIDQVGRLREGHAVVDFENRCRHRDGSYVWLHWSALPLKEEGVVYVAARNVTKAKQLQAELEDARVAADAANRAKSEFLAVMSHELRTPLNGVVGMTELLLGTDLNEQQRHHASLAKLSADTLLALINDILDFSKIEAGQVELERIDFDLREAVEAVAMTIGPQATRKGVELVAFVDPRLCPHRLGDPGRIQQLLLNLMSNAVKFTETGEVVIEVRGDSETESTDRIRVSVRDTGIGIPADRIDALFNPFAQVDASTTRKYGGTGLGLAICKHLVELMGGEIGVESTPGAGTTFSFTLRVPLSAPADLGQRRPDLSGHRVLVVDDNETNRYLLAEHLSVLGIPNSAVPGAVDALRLLARQAKAGEPFDVAYLDMNMPGMNGIELAQTIKNDPAIRDVALILLGSSPAEDPDRLRAAGFECWLTKPIRQSLVIEHILRATTARRPAREGRPERCDYLDLTGRRILVAEDDEISQVLVRTLLNQSGCECEIVANGRDAIEAALTGRFDLVLMDGHMPEMDGFEATSAIRSRERDDAGLARDRGRLPIIAVTANALKGDQARCLEAGMDDYVSKPVSAKRLFATIQRLLRCDEGAPGARESVAAAPSGRRADPS